MGKLLSLLARDESTCCTPQKYDVFLDFESELYINDFSKSFNLNSKCCFSQNLCTNIFRNIVTKLSGQCIICQITIKYQIIQISILK